MFANSRRAEQLSLHSQQSIVVTVEDSVLRTEMADLESQEEDASKSILFFKSMSWLGQIRSHRRDETWCASLLQTFFSSSMDDAHGGIQIPVIVEKPFATCGCKKFQLDPLGDHLNTCATHSGVKKLTKRHTTGWLIKLLTFFARHIRLKHNRWLKAEVNIVMTSAHGISIERGGPGAIGAGSPNCQRQSWE
jgi:hypothetical protein